MDKQPKKTIPKPPPPIVTFFAKKPEEKKAETEKTPLILCEDSPSCCAAISRIFNYCFK